MSIQTSDPHSFHQAVRKASGILQQAVGAVIEALPMSPRKAPDLTRLLGIDRNLAWKIHRLANERDPISAARFIPGDSALEAFLDAAARSGVAQELLDAVRHSRAEYGQVVKLHAGDRASADIMLGTSGAEGPEMALRRAAFRASSYVCGAQAQAQLQTFIMAPSSSGARDMMDGSTIKGFVNLRRIRSDAPVVIGRSICTHDAGVRVVSKGNAPIDPSPDALAVPQADIADIPLLRDFCSSPLPRFRRVPAEHGFVEDELEAGPIGSTGAVTIYTGETIREVSSRYGIPGDPSMEMVMRVRTPVEVAVFDLVIHHGLFGRLLPRAGLYIDYNGEAMRRERASRDRYRLPIPETPEYLGRGVQAVNTPDIPRYPRLLGHAMERLGYNGDDFDVYRVRIEFPYAPTSLVVGHDLLAAR